MQRVGIVGIGLIGGSIAKSLKDKCGVKTIVAFDLNKQSLTDAKGFGYVDEIVGSFDEFAAFSSCEVVFICTPIDTINSYIEKLSKVLTKETILTDVGSAKKCIVDYANQFDTLNFVGGHPMSGSEKTGFDASKAHLFENACYVLCQSDKTNKKSIEIMQNIVQQFGCISVIMDAKEHDYAVSAISHAPHIIAAALTNTVCKLDKKDGKMATLAAGGFRDITRIASSDAALWNAIIVSNKQEVLNTIEQFKQQIDLFVNELNKDETNVTAIFESSKLYRDTFKDKNNASYKEEFTVTMDVTDSVGIIAKVATLLSKNDINIKNIGVMNSREYENGVLKVLFEDEKSKEKSVSLLKENHYIIYE